ncbi:MAG: Lrp/AsnC family transcriptional regulator [Epsilonproteobacteria bacterium]|nr:Lrp/AsnC family transcriptional regulator [Campylobacterota bacterium]
MKLDEIDIQILSILQNEGRITNTELAKRIGISPPPTLERVKKLEKNGVIKKYVAILELAKIGIETCAFIQISLSQHGRVCVDEFMKAVKKIDEVLECHHITGDADFLLKIVVKNIQAYENLLLNRLTALPHIGHLKTMVVLSTLKNSTAYKLKGDENE